MTEQEQVEARRHELKCWPPYFDDVVSGRKPFEVRLNDRGFEEGDLLVLREYIPVPFGTTPAGLTGRSCERRVTYVLGLPEFGIEDGYVVMGLTR